MKYKAIQIDESREYSWAIQIDGKTQMVGFDKETANQIVKALNRDELWGEVVDAIRNICDTPALSFARLKAVKDARILLTKLDALKKVGG